MKLFKKILKILFITLAGAFVVIQFFRPARNISQQPAENNITNQFPVPPEIDAMMRTACYDCHSNNTRYPWYAEVQPVAWWLGDHITKGKDEVNFDEFSSYRLRRQYKKFHEIDEQVSQEKMPLPSYTLIHRDAILSPEQKTALITWTQAMIDSMKAKYPIDSLERKRPTQ